MSFPPATPKKPGFKLTNQFPGPPTLTGDHVKDTAAVAKWWYDTRTVLIRQFNEVAEQIDKLNRAP